MHGPVIYLQGFFPPRILTAQNSILKALFTALTRHTCICGVFLFFIIPSAPPPSKIILFQFKEQKFTFFLTQIHQEVCPKI